MNNLSKIKEKVENELEKVSREIFDMKIVNDMTIRFFQMNYTKCEIKPDYIKCMKCHNMEDPFKSTNIEIILSDAFINELKKHYPEDLI